jgi:hypothetical protein
MDSIKQLDKIYDVLYECGREATELYDKGYGAFYSYSGRGMFGAECVGITVDRDGFREVTKALKKKRILYSTDSMGLDSVVYFQHIPYNPVRELIAGGNND